jgi:hypothetical protein
MRTDTERTDSYIQKYVATTVGLKIASRLATMKTQFAAACQSIVAIELQIQGILGGAGVMTISYPYYLNFGREMWALQFRGQSGAGLEADCLVRNTKYVAYGCDAGILKTIALDVFGITIP